MAEVRELISRGLLHANGKGVSPTARSRLLGNEAFQRLLPEEKEKTRRPVGLFALRSLLDWDRTDREAEILCLGIRLPGCLRLFWC